MLVLSKLQKLTSVQFDHLYYKVSLDLFAQLQKLSQSWLKNSSPTTLQSFLPSGSGPNNLSHC